MKRLLALLWLVILVAAGLHVGWRAVTGFNFQTDLMALLPQAESDPAARQANQVIAQALAQRIVVLVGHRQAPVAAEAGRRLQAALTDEGILRRGDSVPGAPALQALGAAYYPHRAGLMAEADRRALLEDRAADLLARARGQIYGLAGGFDARLLLADPLLLLPAYLTQLPLPGTRLTVTDGQASVRDGEMTWVLVAGQLTGDAYAIGFQERFTAAFDDAARRLRKDAPELDLLRLGTIFYAAEGAREAMRETSFIGTVATVGTLLLILVTFRRASPLLLSLLVGGIGLLVAMSACLLFFERMHVIALLFGASLIGATVDYSLHYFGQIFTERSTASERLAHVMPGLTLGLLTTLIGYATLAVAPFPGLRQIAAFAIIGLLSSFLTVVIWFPLIERTPPARLDASVRHWSLALWRFWDSPRLVPARLILGLALLGACALGLQRLEVSDDIRRQQSLPPQLVAEQTRIQGLTGFGNTAQFFLVRGATSEEVLRREEALGDRLAGAVGAGALGDWRSAARFAPSAARQQENRTLVRERLEEPYLAGLRRELGMPAPSGATSDLSPLSLDSILRTGALPLLAALILDETTHIVMLDGLSQPALMRAAADGLAGVSFVDPTGDITDLLKLYRERAVLLLALSALLMAPLLAWRYGLRGSLWVALPPVISAVATPALLSLVGLPFTFFGAMAMVLVLSIGFDYAVFCAEDAAQREAVTMLSVAVAALTTQLSFGLLAFSQVSAIASFGAAVLTGITLAFLLAPLAARARSRVGLSG